jgi:hypothetical protein
MKVVSAPCMWSPCCIFVNREPRWQQCSNDMADRAKQRNDGLEDQAIDAPSVQNIIRSGGQMKIAFLGVRVPGHLNPMTTLARKLKARGHDVVFLSVPDTEPFVRAAELPEDWPQVVEQLASHRPVIRLNYAEPVTGTDSANASAVSDCVLSAMLRNSKVRAARFRRGNLARPSTANRRLPW